MSNHISETLSYRTPIGLNTVTNPIETPIGEQKNSKIVDLLLQDYADLIEPNYTPWFAKRFYTMPMDMIHRAASEARKEGNNPPRLFIHKIKELST